MLTLGDFPARLRTALTRAASRLHNDGFETPLPFVRRELFETAWSCTWSESAREDCPFQLEDFFIWIPIWRNAYGETELSVHVTIRRLRSKQDDTILHVSPFAASVLVPPIIIPAIADMFRETPAPPDTRETLPERNRRFFDGLVIAWQGEAMYYSVEHKIYGHHAYQSLMGMGRDIVPLIFEKLPRDNDAWDWSHALSQLLDSRVIPEAERGFANKERAHWLAWGREHGYLPS